MGAFSSGNLAAVGAPAPRLALRTPHRPFNGAKRAVSSEDTLQRRQQNLGSRPPACPPEPQEAPHRMRLLLQNSSTPLCCLPNDQLNGLPRGRLSQRQLETAEETSSFTGNDLHPAACAIFRLELGNTLRRAQSAGREACAVGKELALVWPE